MPIVDMLYVEKYLHCIDQRDDTCKLHLSKVQMKQVYLFFQTSTIKRLNSTNDSAVWFGWIELQAYNL